jgi:hypothetical protein
MIFDLHGETLFALLGRDAFGNCPGFQNAVHRQTKVIMETFRCVLLNHEDSL